MKRLLWLSLLVAGVACGQGLQIQNAPPALTPVGTEIFPIAQIGVSTSYTPPAICQSGYCGVGMTLNQIKAFVGAGIGTVTTTGSPAAGQLTAFSGPTSITGANLVGDCSTVNTLNIICAYTQGTPFARSATIDTTNASNITTGTLSLGIFPTNINSNTSGNAATATALAATPSQCTGSQVAQGITANGSANCVTPAGGGNVSSSGSPANGELTFWTSSSTIGNGNLSGDCATTNTGVTTCTKTNGVAFGTLATGNATIPGVSTPTLGLIGLPVAGSVITTNYTFVLTDNSQQKVINCASACTLTIPANASVAFPYTNGAGTCIIADIQPSSATVTLAITTDKITNYTTNTAYTNQTAYAISPPFIFSACKDSATTWWTRN